VTEDGHDYVFRLVPNGHEQDSDHAGHEQENSESGQEHEAHTNEQGEENEEYYIFERTEVKTGQSRGGLTEVTFPDTTFHETRFATGNAQALSSEMKSGSAGHQGHAH
ncbi:MAG: efflux RND transporter periplasmic adaptor subunit, partial [Marinilabilia sp.]